MCRERSGLVINILLTTINNKYTCSNPEQITEIRSRKITVTSIIYFQRFNPWVQLAVYDLDKMRGKKRYLGFEWILQMGWNTILLKDFCGCENAVMLPQLQWFQVILPLQLEPLIFNVRSQFWTKKSNCFPVPPDIEKKNCSVEQEKSNPEKQESKSKWSQMYSFSKMRFISQSLSVIKLDGEQQDYYVLQHCSGELEIYIYAEMEKHTEEWPLE